jgi:hypothetical protein
MEEEKLQNCIELGDENDPRSVYQLTCFEEEEVPYGGYYQAVS